MEVSNEIEDKIEKSPYFWTYLPHMLGSFSAWAYTPNPTREEEAKIKLEQIQQEEKETLEELFELSANIMLIETEIADITEEILIIRENE